MSKKIKGQKINIGDCKCEDCDVAFCNVECGVCGKEIDDAVVNNSIVKCEYCNSEFIVKLKICRINDKGKKEIEK